MTANLPQVSNNTTSLFPTPVEWKMMRDQASMLVKTGFLPKTVDTPEKAIAIMLKGREIGLPPMQALSQINIIQGTPSLKPEGMLALIYKNVPGARIFITTSTDQICEVKAARGQSGSLQPFTFTMEDAKKMSLATKDNWKKQPKVMLQWRAISAMARATFPDAISGCSYTPDELDAPVENPEPIQVESEVMEDPAVYPKDEKGETRGAVINRLLLAWTKWTFKDVREYMRRDFDTVDLSQLNEAQWRFLTEEAIPKLDPKEILAVKPAAIIPKEVDGEVNQEMFEGA